MKRSRSVDETLAAKLAEAYVGIADWMRNKAG